MSSFEQGPADYDSFSCSNSSSSSNSVDLYGLYVVDALNADDRGNEAQVRQEHAPKPKVHVHQTFEERLQIRLSMELDDGNSSMFSLDSLKLSRCPRLWRNASSTNKKNNAIEVSERGSNEDIPVTISFKCEPLTLSNKVKTMDGKNSPALILSPRLKIFSPSAA